ncbi:MAG TPA: hypothetical protein VJT83_05045 [Chitinophagaceae bacterium]|nr:hypothetical protein [Chitinophagaceae bacterium]
MRLEKIITLKKITVLSIWLLALCLNLTAQENSPYSRYGLGDMVPQGNIITRAMGGLSAPYFDYQSVNYLNPATYSKLRVTTFDLGFEVDNRTIREPNNPGKFSSRSANISYVQLGIPIMPKRNWGINFGLRPVTRINYKIQSNRRLTDIDSSATIFEGSGGSYEVFAGTGIAFGKLNVGLNFGYLFGTKDYSSKQILLNDSVAYYKANFQNKSTFGGLALSGGAQYSIQLAKTTFLRLGATGQLKKTFNAKRDRKIESFDYDVNGGTFTIDSAFSETDAKGELNYPGSYSFGFLIDKENEWGFGAEFSGANWSQYRFFGDGDALRNSWQSKIGGHWTPDMLRGKSYWSRVTYRAGFFYGKENIKADGDLNILGFTAGAAFPVRRNVYTNQYTVINTAFEFGQRGNNNNLIRENFFRISVGFSLSDLWFVKRKYN